MQSVRWCNRPVGAIGPLVQSVRQCNDAISQLTVLSYPTALDLKSTASYSKKQRKVVDYRGDNCLLLIIVNELSINGRIPNSTRVRFYGFMTGTLHFIDIQLKRA